MPGGIPLRYSDVLESHSGGFTHLLACVEQRSADFELLAGVILFGYSDAQEPPCGGFSHLTACNYWNNALLVSLSSWCLAGEVLLRYSDALELHSGGLLKRNPHLSSQLTVGNIVVIQLPLPHD